MVQQCFLLVQQVVHDFIQKMKQLILMLVFYLMTMLIILNISSATLNYYQTQLLNSYQLTLMEFLKIEQLPYH